ncbi:hypothetical protein FIM87_13600 [Vibrio cholerae]|nr:hypothetical protein [Vibrio cholerae]EGQ9966126.1 hypothetical protein [Vibrio cholerae]EGR0357000.1 hypothetical protein [Vibrio cholerae]EGR0379803.1 hypothetical protein [Vibrio cholerae]EGR0607969.1 hypothetical protein [Vibrio cholerae]
MLMGMNLLAAYLQLQVVWGSRAKTKPNSKELGLKFVDEIIVLQIIFAAAKRQQFVGTGYAAC